MLGLAGTNTSMIMENPLSLLHFAFESTSAFVVDNFTFPQSCSGEQLDILCPSLDNSFYSENREIISSGEVFQVDDYLNQTMKISGEEILCDFINKITKESISMEPEMLKVINERFWDLF